MKKLYLLPLLLIPLTLVLLFGSSVIDRSNAPEEIYSPLPDRELEKWIKVRLTIGVRFEYPNGSIYRPIHGYVEGGELDNKIVSAYNITVVVQFPYSNETYRGYTEKTYYIEEPILRGGSYAGYYMWEVTSIDGEYTGANAYGWIKDEV